MATLTHSQGKGSITHNNRDFISRNVNPGRTADNITYVRQDIAAAYEQLFGAAVERYNAKQKRADRKISKSYYEHVFGHAPKSSVATSADKRKSFYEDVVQVGGMADMGIGSADGAVAKECLDEYMQGFQARNPQFRVFNAVLHMDEATPHLHIDYIPVAHFGRGVDTQNSLRGALKEMGYGNDKHAIARWREQERAVLKDICAAHGIRIEHEQAARGTLTINEYKEQAQAAERLREQNKALTEQNKTLTEQNTQLNTANQQLRQKNTELQSSYNAVYDDYADLTNKLDGLSSRLDLITKFRENEDSYEKELEVKANKIAMQQAKHEQAVNQSSKYIADTFSAAGFSNVTSMKTAIKILDEQSSDTFGGGYKRIPIKLYKAVKSILLKFSVLLADWLQQRSENQKLTKEVENLKKYKSRLTQVLEYAPDIEQTAAAARAAKHYKQQQQQQPHTKESLRDKINRLAEKTTREDTSIEQLREKKAKRIKDNDIEL